jgi:hypothetical protein
MIVLGISIHLIDIPQGDSTGYGFALRVITRILRRLQGSRERQTADT